MHGDSVDAIDAERIGLVHRVVTAAELMQAARDEARRLLEGPRFALGMTKELLNNALSMDLDTALDAEARAQTICMMGADFREFHAAYVDGRKPRFGSK
jgi:2-(1,2-epoxy-1,2-dihydrophenyl)acetyl-CoA isomerase